MPIPLEDSPSLFHVPDIDFGNAVILADTSCGSWTAMFAAHPDKIDYLLTPGDYRGWGVLDVDNMTGNTEDRPKTIRYFHPGVDDGLHPVRRGNVAMIDSFKFQGGHTQNWLLQGVTIRRPTVHPEIARGPRNITIDFCLIEGARQYGIRIRDAADCTVQRCVIRDSEIVTGAAGEVRDSPGIQIGPIKTEILGIKILDNEIYNIGDGIQLTHLKGNGFLAVAVLIEGNDVYLDPTRYVGGTDTAPAENAVDIKAGSDGINSTVVRGNRMWGFRLNSSPHPTARGELLAVHKYCRNLLVENNIMGDAPRGVADDNWPPGVPAETPRVIMFRGNQFYDIHDYAVGADQGAIAKPVTSSVIFLRNHFARSDFMADDIPPSGYRSEGPYFAENTLVDIGTIQRNQNPPSPAIWPGVDNTLTTAPDGYDTYERKRWTGPELAIGARPRNL